MGTYVNNLLNNLAIIRFFFILKQIFQFLSITFILISSLELSLSTTQYFNVQTQNNSNEGQLLPSNPYLVKIEVICTSWFSIEFFIRFWASPNRFIFFRDPMNIIDFLTILPFFLSILFQIDKLMFSQYFIKIGFLKKILDLMFIASRILRTLRVFKLARYSRGLRILAKTLKQNNKELGLMIMFLSIGVFFFSGLVYNFGTILTNFYSYNGSLFFRKRW